MSYVWHLAKSAGLAALISGMGIVFDRMTSGGAVPYLNEFCRNFSYTLMVAGPVVGGLYAAAGWGEAGREQREQRRKRLREMIEDVSLQSTMIEQENRRVSSLRDYLNNIRRGL